MRKPNLFDFATSELSQDAFICWLLSWASPEHKYADPDLHQAGSRLIRAFFQLHAREAPPAIETVRVERQPKHIDVLCIVNGTFHIIIEDKTGSSAHGNQLTRYVKAIRERGVSEQNIIPIYFKYCVGNINCVRCCGYCHIRIGRFKTLIEIFKINIGQ